MTRRDRTDWRTIIRRIKTGKFTPIISGSVGTRDIPGQDTFVQDWADSANYPFTLSGQNDLTEIAQYLSVTGQDSLTAKEEFLAFLGEHVLQTARDLQSGEQSALLDAIEDEMLDLTFSDVISRLGYPTYEDELDNPLRILAELPLPIYLTSGHNNLIEKALIAAGKQPQTEILAWHEDLDDIESIFETDRNYQPSEEEPLVYHIHGMDTHPSSLVLTQDDYLDFLVSVSEDNELIPRRVGQALADSSLLLLGYNLQSWDFRVIFRGMIKAKRASRRLLSISIQVEPETEADRGDIRNIQDYLENYFGSANFDIYWGSAHKFLQELWENWEG